MASHAPSPAPDTPARRRVGVLLVNVGTPDAPETGAVRRYLREFLSDPRVIDINPLGRWLLLNLIILPTRPAKSAAAYRKIWGKGEFGSPLLNNGHALVRGVQENLGDNFVVRLAMRYQNPSLRDVLTEMQKMDLEKLIVVPLYPQYSSAATGSTLQRIHEILNERWNVPAISTIDSFYDAPGFINAFADVARPLLQDFRPDHVLFSYHGLPERHMLKSDPSGQHCLQRGDCCEEIGPNNRFCYRAQCVATTKSLSSALGLTEANHSFSFQSRLGRTPWVKPYTDLVLPELATRGVRRLAVMSPAFVADCLETLEEIAIRARAQWVGLGGEDLLLVPSLNAHPSWVMAVSDMVRNSGE